MNETQVEERIQQGQYQTEAMGYGFRVSRDEKTIARCTSREVAERIVDALEAKDVREAVAALFTRQPSGETLIRENPAEAERILRDALGSAPEGNPR